MPLEKDVPKELIWHFMRGQMDGDGSIFKSKNNIGVTLGICGGGKFMDEIRELFRKHGINAHIYRQNRMRSCNVSNIIDVVKVGELIYRNSESCRLERKYKRFLSFKNRIIEQYNRFTNIMINLNLIEGVKDLNRSISFQEDGKDLKHVLNILKYDKNHSLK